MYLELLEQRIKEEGRDKFLLAVQGSTCASDAYECIIDFIDRYLAGQKHITVADRVDNFNTLKYFKDTYEDCPRILSIIKKKLKPSHFMKCEKNLKASLGYIYVFKIPDFFNKSVRVPSLNARLANGQRDGKLTFRQGTALYLKVQFFNKGKGIFPDEGYIKVDPERMVLNYASVHPSS